jgi:hypothetical protein
LKSADIYVVTEPTIKNRLNHIELNKAIEFCCPSHHAEGRVDPKVDEGKMVFAFGYHRADPGHILFLRIYILSPITAKKVIKYPIPYHGKKKDRILYPILLENEPTMD